MTISRPRILMMLIGAPGCGKSYFRNRFMAFNPDLNIAIVSSDDYIDARAKEQNSTYAEVFDKEIKNASKYVNEVSDAFVKNAMIDIVIWDQTNMTVKSRASKIAKFKNEGWEVHAVTFENVDWATFLTRAKKRKDEGKDIPLNIINSMLDNYEAPTMEEGFDRIIVL